MPILYKTGLTLLCIGIACCFISSLHYSSGAPEVIKKLNKKLASGIATIAILSSFLGLILLGISG